MANVRKLLALLICCLLVNGNLAATLWAAAKCCHSLPDGPDQDQSDLLTVEDAADDVESDLGLLALHSLAPPSKPGCYSFAGNPSATPHDLIYALHNLRI